MSDEIKASDLAKLMAVVDAAVGLYNVLEGEDNQPDLIDAFNELGEKLRELGLQEVTDG